MDSWPGMGDGPAAHPRSLASGEDRAASARRVARTGEGNAALDRLAELASRLLGTASSQVSVVADVRNVTGGEEAVSGASGPDGSATDSL